MNRISHLLLNFSSVRFFGSSIWTSLRWLNPWINKSTPKHTHTRAHNAIAYSEDSILFTWDILVCWYEFLLKLFQTKEKATTKKDSAELLLNLKLDTYLEQQWHFKEQKKGICGWMRQAFRRKTTWLLTITKKFISTNKQRRLLYTQCAGFTATAHSTKYSMLSESHIYIVAVYLV